MSKTIQKVQQLELNANNQYVVPPKQPNRLMGVLVMLSVATLAAYTYKTYLEVNNKSKPIDHLTMVKKHLKAIYQKEEAQLVDEKAELYAERDARGMQQFYQTSYEKQKDYLANEKIAVYCKYHSQDKQCQQKENPLQLTNNQVQLLENQPMPKIARGKMPNNPFSWTAKKAPPPAPKKPKQEEYDGIGSIVAENNLKNMIKARY